MSNLDLNISCFLEDGFNLKNHLIEFLNINNDQLVNVQDIILVINCILTNDCIGLCTDLNNNGTTDVVDIVLLVNLILD